MIDLHCHLLPGVDDGPEELAESVAMCRLAASDGCHTIVVTPHYNHPIWPNEDLQGLDERRAELEHTVGAFPALRRGAEIRVSSALVQDLEKLSRAQVPSLAGSRYLLLEFERGARPQPEANAILHELQIAGWFPVIAHPEFVPWLVTDLDAVVALASRGTLFQITAMSVTGDFGPRPAAFCDELLSRGLAQFVASDAHGAERRPPGLGRARQTVERRLGPDAARALFEVNPAAVLADEPLVVPS